MSGLRTTWTLAWTRLRCLHKNIGQLLVLMSLTVWTPVLATAQPVILQELQNPGPNTVGFGASIAVDGDTLVVGAPYFDPSRLQRGAVYIFVKVGGNWVLQQTLARSTGVQFGHSVAVSGDTLIVASGYNSGISNPGPLVFVRSNGTWTQQAELVPSAATMRTGERVEIDGNIALVATRGHGVYAFVRSGSTWTQQATLLAERDYGTINQSVVFEVSIDLKGETALVGVGGETVGANAQQGAAYVFHRAGGVWTQQATLTATPGRAREWFGFGVALSGDTALVIGQQVYQFQRTGNTWVQQPRVELPPAPIPVTYPVFVALDGDTAIVSVRLDPRAPTTSYVYRRIGGRWVCLEPGFRHLNFVIAGDTMIGGDSYYGDTPDFEGPGRVFVYSVPQAAPPSAPELTGLVSGNTVTLSWTEPTSGGASSYVVEAGRAAGASDVFNGNVGDTLELSAPVPPATYFVRVRGLNGFGLGPASNEVVLTVAGANPPPGPPSNLAANVSGNTVNFTWNGPATGSAVGNYVLVAGLTPGFAVPVATVSLGSTPGFAAPGVSPGTFYARVLAQNAGGTSAPSNEVAFTVAGLTAPGAPTLNAPTVNGSTLLFSWSPGSGGTPTSYTLTARSTSGGAPIAVVPLSGTSAAFTGVPAGGYFARLTASNGAGTSAASNEVNFTVAGATLPAAPTLHAPVVDGSTVTVSWSVGGGGAPASYTLTASAAPGGAPIVTVPIVGTSASFPNVPLGTYYLRLTATNGAGTSPPSAEVMLRVP